MTQAQTILRHMQTHGCISTLEAFQLYSITRLSARIWDLRHDGYDIVSETVSTKRGDKTISYAVYALDKEAKDEEQGESSVSD